MKKSNIGLIVGQNAVGKSWFLRNLMAHLPSDLPIAVLSEAQFFLHYIDIEHWLKNGYISNNMSVFNHDHPWCKGALYHSHERNINKVVYHDRVQYISYKVRKNKIPFNIQNPYVAVKMR